MHRDDFKQILLQTFIRSIRSYTDVLVAGTDKIQIRFLAEHLCHL